MIEARVGRRMRALGIDDPNAYYALVTSNQTEQNQFVDHVTTHETSFFRTPRIWRYLEETFLPSWLTNKTNSVCRVWSAATSSGEEAYSLAMLFHQLKRHNPNFDFRVTATDISKQMIDHCHRAHYQRRSVVNIIKHYPLLARQYLMVKRNGYQVRSDLKEHIQFSTQNLYHQPQRVAAYDLILLRNVLIYFSQPDQEVVLNHMHSALKQKGTLIIGESESLMHSSAKFENCIPGVYQTRSLAAATKATD